MGQSQDQIHIAPIALEDAPSLAAIYNYYVEHTTVSFEEAPISESELLVRAEAVKNAGLPWLVAKVDNQISGYAYASPWRTRSAYRFSVEVSVYVERDSRGKGLGFALYKALFAALESKGVHAIVAGITLPNPESVTFHEKLGLIKTAHFTEIGQKFGKWLDVGYWQKNV